MEEGIIIFFILRKEKKIILLVLILDEETMIWRKLILYKKIFKDTDKKLHSKTLKKKTFLIYYRVNILKKSFRELISLYLRFLNKKNYIESKDLVTTLVKNVVNRRLKPYS